MSCWRPRHRRCARRRTDPQVIARIEEALGQELQVLGANPRPASPSSRCAGGSDGPRARSSSSTSAAARSSSRPEATSCPQVAASVPLGAGRMTIEFLPRTHPAGRVDVLRDTRARCWRRSSRSSSLSRVPTTSWDHRRRSARSRSSPATRCPAGREATGCCSPRRPRLVDSAARPHPGLCPAGAPRDHGGPHLAVRRGRGRAARGDDGAQGGRARSEPLGAREGVPLRYTESMSWG